MLKISPSSSSSSCCAADTLGLETLNKCYKWPSLGGDARGKQQAIIRGNVVYNGVYLILEISKFKSILYERIGRR
jgi:hypothetical protein